MPEQVKYATKDGFALMGNLTKGSIEADEEFLLSNETNKFGPGRKMVTVFNLSGCIIGYVTEGQADLIRKGIA